MSIAAGSHSPSSDHLHDHKKVNYTQARPYGTQEILKGLVQNKITNTVTKLHLDLFNLNNSSGY